MDKETKKKLTELIESSIKAEGAFFEHYDKYDRKGRVLWEKRNSTRKKLDEFISKL